MSQRWLLTCVSWLLVALLPILPSSEAMAASLSSELSALSLDRAENIEQDSPAFVQDHPLDSLDSLDTLDTVVQNPHLVSRDLLPTTHHRDQLVAALHISVAQDAFLRDVMMQDVAGQDVQKNPISETIEVKPQKPTWLISDQDSLRISDDMRLFWTVMGGGAVTTLASRVLVAGPLFLSNLTVFGATSTVPVLPFLLALTAGYLLIDSVVTAVILQLTYNGSAAYSDGDWVPAFVGHFLGNIASTAITTLIFGLGIMQLFGVQTLSAFIGSGASQVLGVFSVLGILPALVLAGIISIGMPSVMGTWGLLMSARPRRDQKKVAKVSVTVGESVASYHLRNQLRVLPENQQNQVTTALFHVDF